MTRIGQIARVDSILYWWGAVYHERVVELAPGQYDYSYGTFVKVRGPDIDLVGIINDICIYNPEYGIPSVKPNSQEALRDLYTDFADEVRELIRIYCLGSLTEGMFNHAYPKIVPKVHDEIFKMGDDDIKKFHFMGDDIYLGYLPRLSTFNDYVHMLSAISDTLSRISPSSAPLLGKLMRDCQFKTCIRGLGERR